MQAPYSRMPAVPAAIGLSSGIALEAAPVAAPVLWAVGVLAAVAALWLWRFGRFFAAAPAAIVVGIAAACAASGGPSLPEPPVREAITEAIYMSPMSGAAASFAATTIVADDTFLHAALRDDFRGSGLAHLLALSGFHVGVVAMIAMWLSAPMMLLGRARRLRWLVVLCAVWAFALLGGMRPSLMRAAVMCTMLLAARALERYPSPLNSLAVAAIVILLLNPSALYDVGFQLSFAAVAGILVFAPALNPVAPRRRYLCAAVAAVAVPVSATLATAPIVAAVFGTFPLLFLPANALASLLFAPFYVCALAVVALSWLGLPCGAFALCADLLYALMAGASSLLNHAVQVSLPAVAVVFVYIVLAGAAWAILRKKS